MQDPEQYIEDENYDFEETVTIYGDSSEYYPEFSRKLEELCQYYGYEVTIWDKKSLVLR